MSYYTEAIIKHIITNVATEGKEAYQKFFTGALKKFGVSSPMELSGEKKKDFFNYVRYANPNVSKIIKLRNGNNSCCFKMIINKRVYFLKYYNILSNLDYKRQEAEIMGYNYYKKKDPCNLKHNY